MPTPVSSLSPQTLHLERTLVASGFVLGEVAPSFDPPPRELRESLVRVREESTLADAIGRVFRMEMDWDDSAA